MGEVPVDVPNVAGTKNVSLKIPCGLFSRGGTYSLELQHKSAPVPDRFSDAAASFHDAQVSFRKLRLDCFVCVCVFGCCSEDWKFEMENLVSRSGGLWKVILGRFGSILRVGIDRLSN